jgi:hypothetical protein
LPHRFNIGKQLADFKSCEPAELDDMLAGIKASLVGSEPEVGSVEKWMHPHRAQRLWLVAHATSEKLIPVVILFDAQVSIAEYVPKAMKLLQAKAEAAAAAQAAKGLEFLAEAANEEGASQTSSGLVVKTLREGTGDSPTAAETVQASPPSRGRICHRRIIACFAPRLKPPSAILPMANPTFTGLFAPP